MLEIGARDGHFSRLLADHFAEVTALDLQAPSFEFARVRTVAGDATNLQFADGSFDCVFCTEVLEHIPDLERACREIMRVALHEIVIGVPYKQDLRVGRSTCQSCGRTNPPWGHVNSFDETRLLRLFPGLRVVSRSLVGSSGESSNAVAAFLMDLGGNPWGTYIQEEPCIHCGAALAPPENRQLWQKALSGIAWGMNRMQTLCARPRADWIHLVLSKTP